MKRKSIARLIAVLFVGYGLAFLIMSNDATDLAHYRTMSHEALLAELAKKNNDSFDGAFFISLFLVAAITGLVEGLAVLVELAMNRISPLDELHDSTLEGDVAAGPRFH